MFFARVFGFSFFHTEYNVAIGSWKGKLLSQGPSSRCLINRIVLNWEH